MQNDPLDLLINLTLTTKVAENVVPVSETPPAALVAEVKRRVLIEQLTAARTQCEFLPLGLPEYIRRLATSAQKNLAPILAGKTNADEPSLWIGLAEKLGMQLEEIKLHLRIGFYQTYKHQMQSGALARGEYFAPAMECQTPGETRKFLERLERTYPDHLSEMLAETLEDLS